MKNEVTLIENQSLREKYYKISHQSGLQIFVFPKELSAYYALFGTKYGAIDNRFKPAGVAEPISVPDGIAHFLEHKLFETESGEETDARFAALGASSNAFTSADMTAYEFTCTESFYEALEILLDFVTHPYFTDENVAKEQGIIGQEIDMCNDMPMRRLYYELLDALYPHNNIRIPVCGTQESIAKITPEYLYTCYNTFYRLSNMALVVCGSIDPGKVVAIADAVLPKEEPLAIDRYFEADSLGVAQKRRSTTMQVARPLFAIGVKDEEPHAGTAQGARRALQLRIVADWLFGTSSGFYEQAYDAGLLNPKFSTGYEGYRSCGFFMLSGETDDPEEIYRRVLATVEEAKKTPPAREDFLRVRRALYADYIRDFDSTEEIANNLLSYCFTGVDLLEVGDMINSITYEEALSLIQSFFLEERFAMATILPKTQSARK